VQQPEHGDVHEQSSAPRYTPSPEHASVHHEREEAPVSHARPEPVTASADIVKVADEIVREDFRTAPPAAAPVPAPAPVAAPVMPAPVTHAPPPVELEWPSDLVQVESDPGKLKATQQAAAEESAPRPRRERPVRPPVVEEPLVQIETGGKSPAETPPA